MDEGEVRSAADELLDASAHDRLDTMRHSTAHVMAASVLELFPEAKLGIGPAIKDGFYYDFDLPLLRLTQYDPREPVRPDTVPGHLPLRRLPPAVRGLQAGLGVAGAWANRYASPHGNGRRRGQVGGR